MAKKEKLAFEELLGRALVKDEYKPYEVPANWVWTRLGEINFKKSKTIDPKRKPTEKFELYSVPSYDGDFPELLFGEEIGSTKQIVKKNDVLLCKINPRINRVWIVSEHTDLINVASSEWIVITITKLNPKYLLWCLRSKFFRELMVSNVSGVGGSLTRSRPKEVCNFPIPIPPLPEQQRIVGLIESLFERLDRAKELAQNALDSFENRKSAILHKAFSGELTAKWREENGVDYEKDWEEKTLNDICSKITDGTHNSPKNYDAGEYMYVTAKNIKEHGIDLSNITFISAEFHKEIYKRCNVEYEDVLYIKDGATTGIATVNTLKEEFSLLSSVALLKPNKIKLVSKYLAYNLNSSETKSKMLSNMSGNAITRLTISKIQKSTIVVPPLPEQKEIVRILDSLLENEQKAKELCDVIEKIDLMKKSILARAFSGELSTNNPEEESALELLKEVLRERV